MFNVIINSEQYDEFMAQKEKIKDLEARIKETDERHESLYKEYQQAFKEADKDKAALIKENDRLTNFVHEQESDIINLRAKNYELKVNNKELKAKITLNPCRDLEEAYSPDSNTIVKIKNLYITNNYFSQEDENNGSK